MKIAIVSNHSHRHTGGSEIVLKAISDRLVSQYDHKVIVISRTTKKQFEDNGVVYHPCPTQFDRFALFIDEEKVDHLFVYSDYFCLWKDILSNPHICDCKKSIALVGANALRESSYMQRVFRENHRFFNIITHSDNYLDYTTCNDMGVPVTVVPNGVDLSEFTDNTIDFRSKYKIGDRKFILCVSNFFPGKGQEYLVKTLGKLQNERDDFTAVFISSTVNFSFAKTLSHQCQSELKRLGIKHKFLTDIPREDVVSAFNHADIFAFPSQKEVAPIVVLECGAAKLPWIAMPVGNVRALRGGLMIPFNGRDKLGFMLYGDMSYKMFIQHLNTLLDDQTTNDTLGEEGYQFVKTHHNWDKIVSSYHTLFKKNL